MSNHITMNFNNQEFQQKKLKKIKKFQKIPKNETLKKKRDFPLSGEQR